MNKSIEENRPAQLSKPIRIDTYRMQIKKGAIVLEFGNFNSKESESVVDVVASISFDPMLLSDVVLKLFDVGCKYQEKYKVDIDFPEIKKDNE